MPYDLPRSTLHHDFVSSARHRELWVVLVVAGTVGYRHALAVFIYQFVILTHAPTDLFLDTADVRHGQSTALTGAHGGAVRVVAIFSAGKT